MGDDNSSKLVIPQLPGVLFHAVVINGVPRFTFVSQQSRDILGISSSDMVAMKNPLIELCEESGRRDLVAAVNEVCDQQGQFQWRGQIVTPDGKRKWIKVSASVNENSQEEVFWDGFILDVTDEEDLRGKLERERMSLQHAGSLVAIGELASGVGHEINNPLAVLIGYTARAKKRLVAGKLDDQEVGDLLDKQAKACDRIKKIIDGLRTFALKDLDDSGTMICDLRDVVEDNLSLVGTIYQADGIVLETNFPEGVPNAAIRKGRAQQVVMNLLSNARDAFRTNAATDAVKQITISIYDDGPMWNVEIKDNGSGIPQTIQNQIFESFFTTKSVGEGIGLGLSLCKSIMLDCGGTIEVESEEGKGTTFRLQFLKAKPVVVEVERDEKVAAPIDPTSQKDGISVLIVDDDQEVASLLATLLSDKGCVAQVAYNGVEALNLIKKQHFDVLVTDLVMPEMDGLTLLNEIDRLKLATRTLKFVTTGGTLKEIRERISDKRMGQVDGFLAKPFTKDSIEAVMDKARQFVAEATKVG